MSISQNFPSTRPSLNLNFARSKKLDPRITFTRSSSATRTNAQGLIEVVGTNTSVTMPTCNMSRIGSDGNNYINGRIAQITYYSKRLSNSQVISLTR